MKMQSQAFIEHQVRKIHELKGFFSTKFVNFIQMYNNFVSLNRMYKIFM